MCYKEKNERKRVVHMEKRRFIDEQDDTKLSPSKKKGPLTSEEIKERDKKKGQFRSEAEKSKTRSQNLKYINNYINKHYVKTVFAFQPKDRVQLETQAKLSGETLVQYVLRLIKEDQQNYNYNGEEYQSIYNDKLNKYTEKFKDDQSLSSGLKEEREQEKEEQVKKILKDAEEYFGKDPFSVSKTERAKFILKNTNYGEDKGFIQTYCNALDVSRAWFYMCMQKMKEG